MAVTSSGQLVVGLDAVTGSHGAQIRIYNLSDLSATPTTVDLEFTADQIYAANNELILVDVSGTKVGRYQLSSGTLTTKDTGVTISRSAISRKAGLRNSFHSVISSKASAPFSASYLLSM